MRLSSIVLGLLTTASVTYANGGEPGEGVRTRQVEMKAMSVAAKRLSEYFSGKRPYDIQGFRATARDITMRSGKRLIDYFAGDATAENSAASPSIVEDRAKFDALAHDLERYSRQVDDSAVAGKDLTSGMKMRTGEVLEGGPFAKKKAGTPDIASFSSEHAFHMMLQTCTACHAAFRLKR